mmetsp:Transcript_65108/g.121341  ORF Transcript_65108/g.121341 Transcript_65108/m.121341 type:complete len:221 (-) Transcript_65108:57-719(-)
MARMSYILVGTESVGKSTILNGYTQQLRFKAKADNDFQTEEVGGKVLIEARMHENEATQKAVVDGIRKAVNKGGPCKVIFVETLQSGRVQVNQKSAMERVLKEVPEIGNRYGVILNVVSKAYIKNFLEDPAKKNELMGNLLRDMPAATTKVHHFQKDSDLEGEEDQFKPLPEDLRTFIDDVPTIQGSGAGGSRESSPSAHGEVPNSEASSCAFCSGCVVQ